MSPNRAILLLLERRAAHARPQVNVNVQFAFTPSENNQLYSRAESMERIVLAKQFARTGFLQVRAEYLDADTVFATLPRSLISFW